MGKVIYPRKGEVHTAPVTWPAVFADATWEQIIAACETDTVPATWEIGDQKTMTINGTDYPIDIIGKNHDEYSDGSGMAPLTFQMHDCYGTRYYINSSATNSGGWSGCAMRNTNLPSILALMPSEVRAGIKEVNKLTSVGSQSSTITTTSDKLFLLSEIEIFGSNNQSYTGEGNQYSYYSAGNSAVKKLSGSAFAWWTRSPVTGSTNAFVYAKTDGATGVTSPNVKYGVAFAFCF